MHLKIPPPLVVAIGFVLIYFGAIWLPDLTFAFPGQIAVAALFLIAGLGMGAHALAGFIHRRTTFNPMTPDKAGTLVTGGFYRISRNPMYVADVLLLLAFGVYLGTAAVVAVAPAFIWYITEFQIKPEEESLRKIFGAEYEAYLGRVRRWL